MILAPMVRGRKGKHQEVMERIRKEGFVRVRIDGVTCALEDAPELKARQLHDIDAVVDRVVIRAGLESRLSESVRLALKHGEGALRISFLTPAAKERANGAAEADWQERVFSTQYACPDCRRNLAEVEPRTFSFNSPYGACRTCEGLAAREGFDADLVLPDLSLSLAEGAIAPWREDTSTAQTKHRKTLAPFLERADVDATAPLGRWPRAAREQLLHGDGKDFLGVVAHLEMDYAGTRREKVRSYLSEFRSQIQCPDCGGSRLQPEARACRLGGKAIHEITALPIGAARAFFEQLEFPPHQEPIGGPLVAEIRKRIQFLCQVGVDYLALDRPADSLSGSG